VIVRVSTKQCLPASVDAEFVATGEVSSIAADGAADHVEELSQRYFGQPFPWPNGRDETRLILTINARSIFTAMG
jgi:hypothetical protein